MYMSNHKSSYNKWTILLLLAMLAAGCLYIFHPFLFGNEHLTFYDSGSDTMQQYLMWYNGIAGRLRSGTFSLWDFRNGLGVNEFNLNLTEPFLLGLYLIGAVFGPEKIAGALVYMQIIKVMLSGLFCYLFLSQFSFREEAKLLPSFVYGFNGYLMIWGQHYQMGTIVVLLPLLLMFAERRIRGRKKALFGVALVCMVVILSGYYQGYMTMLGVGIYLTGRVLLYENGTLKARFGMLCSLAAFMLLGVLMGSVNLLPSLASVGSSTRINYKTTALGRFIRDLAPWYRSYYKVLVYRLFGSNLLGTPNTFFGGGNYFEEINLFFSTLLIVLLFQYPALLIRQKTSLRQKAAQVLGFVFIAFMILIKAGSLMFNGFVYAFSRHTFLLMPFFALLCAYVLHELFDGAKSSLPLLLLAALVMTAVYARAYMVNPENRCRNSIMVLLLTGLAMTAAIRVIGSGASPQKGSGRRNLVSAEGTSSLRQVRSACAYAALLGVTMVNLLSDTSLCYWDRLSLKKDNAAYYDELYTGDTVRALRWIREQDGSFFRMDKDYQETGSMLESLAQDFYGVSTYNSTQNEYVATMINRLWPNQLTGLDYAHTGFGNTVHEQVPASLAGVKYILSHDDSMAMSGYELIHQEGSVYVYRNHGTEGIASFFTATMPASRFKKANGSLDTWDLLPEVLLTAGTANYALTEEEILAYREQTDPDILDREKLTVPLVEDETRGLMLDGVQELVIPINEEAFSKYRHVTAELVIETDQSDGMQILVDEVHPINYYSVSYQNRRIELPPGCTQIVIRTDSVDTNIHVQNLQFTVSDKERKLSDQAQISIAAPKKDSYLEGTVTAAQSGYLMLAIPFQDGWTVTLDGETVTPVRADYGFMAIDVPEGGHVFTASFTPPMLKAGLAASAAGMLLWIAGLILMTLREKKRTREAHA